VYLSKKKSTDSPFNSLKDCTKLHLHLQKKKKKGLQKIYKKQQEKLGLQSKGGASSPSSGG
jgi:hypothetical protein